jgi:hypothetical protein
MRTELDCTGKHLEVFNWKSNGLLNWKSGFDGENNLDNYKLYVKRYFDHYVKDWRRKNKTSNHNLVLGENNVEYLANLHFHRKEINISKHKSEGKVSNLISKLESYEGNVINPHFRDELDLELGKYLANTVKEGLIMLSSVNRVSEAYLTNVHLALNALEDVFDKTKFVSYLEGFDKDLEHGRKYVEVLADMGGNKLSEKLNIATKEKLSFNNSRNILIAINLSNYKNAYLLTKSS